MIFYFLHGKSTSWAIYREYFLFFGGSLSKSMYYIHCQISNFLAQLHQRTSHLWHRDSNQRGLEQLGREGCSKMLNALGLWGLTKAWYRKMIQNQKQDPLLWRNSGCFNESCGEFPTRSFTSYLRCVQTDIRCDWLFREDLQKLKEWDLAS